MKSKFPFKIGDIVCSNYFRNRLPIIITELVMRPGTISRNGIHYARGVSLIDSRYDQGWHLYEKEWYDRDYGWELCTDNDIVSTLDSYMATQALKPDLKLSVYNDAISIYRNDDEQLYLSETDALLLKQALNSYIR